MLPTFSPEGVRLHIAWYVAERIIAQFDAGMVEGARKRAEGIKVDPFADKPKHVRMTAQEALDAVCARARANRFTAAA